MNRMLFLLRSAFWLGLVMILLPAPQRAEIAAAVPSSSALTEIIDTPCARQPEACLTALGTASRLAGQWNEKGLPAFDSLEPKDRKTPHRLPEKRS